MYYINPLIRHCVSTRHCTASGISFLLIPAFVYFQVDNLCSSRCHWQTATAVCARLPVPVCASAALPLPVVPFITCVRVCVAVPLAVPVRRRRPGGRRATAVTVTVSESESESESHMALPLAVPVAVTVQQCATDSVCVALACEWYGPCHCHRDCCAA